jgi:hypothetical protein
MKDDFAFLSWLAYRLVNVYGESPNTDFVQRLRKIAGTRTTTSQTLTMFGRQISPLPPEGERLNDHEAWSLAARLHPAVFASSDIDGKALKLTRIPLPGTLVKAPTWEEAFLELYNKHPDFFK